MAVPIGDFRLKLADFENLGEPGLGVLEQVRDLLDAALILGIDDIAPGELGAQPATGALLGVFLEAVLAEDAIAIHDESPSSFIAVLAEVFGDPIFLHKIFG